MMTQQNYASKLKQRSNYALKIQELKDAEQTTIDKKTSGKQKLKDLGLTKMMR